MIAVVITISLLKLRRHMHGFHQGCPVLDDIIPRYNPDVILLQKHWLIPANLCKFDVHFPDYFSFGSLSMTSCVEAGMLRGRPFGNVITLINNTLRKITETVCCSDRYVIVKIADCLLVNVYLPCDGTINVNLICDDVLADIYAWRQRYNKCQIVVAGDFNANLDVSDSVSRAVSHFIDDCSLLRCDDLFPREKVPTLCHIMLILL